jgi:hypothetical protein
MWSAWSGVPAGFRNGRLHSLPFSMVVLDFGCLYT